MRRKVAYTDGQTGMLTFHFPNCAGTEILREAGTQTAPTGTSMGRIWCTLTPRARVKLLLEGSVALAAWSSLFSFFLVSRALRSAALGVCPFLFPLSFSSRSP